MSEKPFWEGKTCTEMADLHVKVTFKDGTVATGVTGANGDIKRVFPLSNGSGNDKFIPKDYIESIELVDESISVPDERIEKAAIAIFAAQTNWAEPNPTQKTVKALWDGQMDAVRDSFRRLAKAALDSLEDRPADLDWENAEPKELDNRLVEAVTKGGTIVRGRTVAVQGSLDQLIVEGVLQPLLIRFPGEHWRLANGWKTLNFYKREADSGLHRP